MYVLVRSDQSYAQIVVQAAHAVLESTRKFVGDADHPHLVICEANNILDLLDQKCRIDREGIKSVVFCEADVGGLPTALATEIIYGAARRNFKNWKLLKQSGSVA